MSNALRIAATFSALSLTIVQVPIQTFAAGTATIELQPYCLEDNKDGGVFGGLPEVDELFNYPSGGKCDPFTVKDPTTLQTSVLDEGAYLDMNVVIQNPELKPIQRFSIWISYDSSILEGVSLSVNDVFGIPTPGENVFLEKDGLIKLSGTAFSPVVDAKIFAARILLKVKDARYSGTPISFFDTSSTAASKTAVLALQADQEENILQSSIGSLFVRLSGEDIAQEPAQSSSIATADQKATTTDNTMPEDVVNASSASENTTYTTSSAQSGSGTDTSHTASTETVFRLLQVQNLRLTTEGNNVYLGWDQLPSSELVGYNLYYGTTTGRYIQRRSIDRTASSVTIRSLPTGSTYYFAIRGVNSAGEETSFSNEQGISVGNPLTSTSPLTASAIPNPTPETDGNVSGETGVGSVLLVFVLLSAVTGTILAYRRQVAASSLIHD